jgi:DNA-binding FadR family transcriptional regulator
VVERAPLPALPPIRRVKVAQLVATELRNQIVRRQLQAGDALPPEAELVARFGVSRPTMREAIHILESEGFVTVRRGARGGVRVRGMREGDAARSTGWLLQARGTTVGDVHGARCILEPAAVRLLAASRGGGAAGALRAAADESPAAFERALVEASGNATLRLLSDLARRVLEAHRGGEPAAAAARPASARRQAAAQRRVLELVEAGDAAGAEAFWRDHLLASRPTGDDATAPLELLGPPEDRGVSP